MIKLMLGFLLLMSACSEFNSTVGLKDDHPMEQAAEKMIHDETGVKVDFTPDEAK